MSTPVFDTQFFHYAAEGESLCSRMNRLPMLRVPGQRLLSIPSFISFCNVTSKWTIAIKKRLLVAPRFCDHLRKHSLAQPGLKCSLCILQQLCHCLFMSATGSARLFFWILVNRKNKGCLYCFVNLQQTDLMCWPRQR